MSRTLVWTLHSTVAAMALTGLWLCWIVFFAADPVESAEEMFAVQHPWQASVTTAHILIGPLLVFSIGLIWRDHVWRGIHLSYRKRRPSGLPLAGLFVLLVLSGYGLQVTEAEGLRSLLGWTHASVGTLFGLSYFIHQLARRRQIRRGRNGRDPTTTRATT